MPTPHTWIGQQGELHISNDQSTHNLYYQTDKYILIVDEQWFRTHCRLMTMTMTIFYSTVYIQIEIIMYNSLENQIINWSGDYY